MFTGFGGLLSTVIIHFQDSVLAQGLTVGSRQPARGQISSIPAGTWRFQLLNPNRGGRRWFCSGPKGQDFSQHCCNFTEYGQRSLLPRLMTQLWGRGQPSLNVLHVHRLQEGSNLEMIQPILWQMFPSVLGLESSLIFEMKQS